MKEFKKLLFLLLMIKDVSTNAQDAEITCEGEQLINIDILTGHPSLAPPYKPGHVLVFRCTDVNLKMQGQRAIECLSNGKWNYPYPKCEERRCEVPRDQHVSRPDQYFRGDMKVGAKRQYTCEPGYEKMAEEATCTRDGWTPNPLCAEVTCEGEQLINVNILVGHPSLAPPYKPGHVLVFRCTDVNLKMQGQQAIECLSNGKWNYPYPKCEERRCEVPRDQHVSRPDQYFRGDMKVGAKQQYTCEPGYEKMEEMATCTRDGWTPNPLCAEVTCEGEQLINANILVGYPGTDPPYKLGHVLVFHCSDVNLKIQRRRAIECLSNGKWDHPYPKCEEIRCDVPRDQHVLRPDQYFSEDMKLESKQQYYCEYGYEKMAEEATCTRDGWTPNPLCAESRCEVPHDQHVSSPHQYFRGVMKVGAKQQYNCESGYEKMAEEATCTRDGWTPKPLCAVMRVSGKCGPPPQVDNADTAEMTKDEYNTGERVEYICFNKYTLDQRRPFSKYLTCQQGQWRGNIKCLKPCTVTKEIMNGRGIDLAHSAEQKMFVPHDDHITFACLRGKYSVGIKFRQKCNDGEMTLPGCV